MKQKAAKIINEDTITIIIIFVISSSAILYSIFNKPDISEDLSVIPFLVGIVIISAFASLRSPYLMFKILLFLIVFQNFSLIILSNFLDSTAIFSLMICKDVCAFAALIVYFMKYKFRKIKITAIDFLIIAFISMNVLYLFFFHSSNLFAQLVSLKENIMLYIFYFLGRYLPLGQNQLNKTVKVLINFSIFIAVFGFIERFFLGDQFWISLGIHELARDQKVFDIFLFGEYGKEIASPMFYFVGNLSLRRMASIFAQPPLTAHFLALPFLILLFHPKIYTKDKIKIQITMMLIGLAIVLTIGRGGILIVLIGIIFKYFKKSHRKTALAIILLLLLIFGVNSMSHYFNLEYGIFTLKHGGGRHVGGLMMALASLTYPFGHGLASGGEKASWYGNEEARYMSYWESYVGSLGYQMGILGLVLFISINLLIFFRLFFKRHDTLPDPQEKFNIAIATAIFGLLVTSFFTSASVGVQSSGFYLLYAGLCISNPDNAFGIKRKSRVPHG